MIIPVYNEARIIGRKIDNISALEYPRDKLEAIFVDGASTDGTSEIIRHSAKENPDLVKFAKQPHRDGYNAAVLDGFRRSTGEIIVITQADASYDSQALKHLTKHFRDPGIGAVSGKQVIENPDESLGTGLSAVYGAYYDFVRLAETQMDSPFDIKGEVCAIRREICEHLLSRVDLKTKACVDCCLSCQSRLEGYKTVFEPQAKYYEYVPKGIIERMKQQVRRGTILIESLLMYRRMLLNRAYGSFGLVILPAHLVMLVVIPCLIVIGIACLPGAVLSDPVKWSIILVPASLGLLISRRLKTFAVSFLQSQFSLVGSVLRVAAGSDSQKIAKVASTRR
jgi:cellulose synthase/poly-beta-1,6-N-acetylglucosamine synthase-like glycosyltransferase